MIVDIVNFLGKRVSGMLSETPFRNWKYEKSLEEDLDELIVDYVFDENGMALSCDRDGRIRTIFLFSDEYGGFDGSLFETPLWWSRMDVLNHYGVPSKSGEARTDPVFGKLGAWDRFAGSAHTIHFEYRAGSDRIEKITLMRNDVVP